VHRPYLVGLDSFGQSYRDAYVRTCQNDSAGKTSGVATTVLKFSTIKIKWDNFLL
jgi:hypothetical protein